METTTTDLHVPWYKDADATRIVIGVGYLVVLVVLVTLIIFTWQSVPNDTKTVVLPIVGVITTAAAYSLKSLAGDPSTKEAEWKQKFERQEQELDSLRLALAQETAKRESLAQVVNDLHKRIIDNLPLLQGVEGIID